MFNGTSGDQTIKKLVVAIAEVLFIAKMKCEIKDQKTTLQGASQSGKIIKLDCGRDAFRRSK